MDLNLLDGIAKDLVDIGTGCFVVLLVILAIRIAFGFFGRENV